MTGFPYDGDDAGDLQAAEDALLEAEFHADLRTDRLPGLPVVASCEWEARIQHLVGTHPLTDDTGFCPGGLL